ncbi:MAG: hypothetical protein J6Z01_14470 [Bacteroidales bacterium]|nr:hypothetical protein [Bacteroidales bacterium]
MKYILAILSLLLSTYAAAQNLTLAELQNLCKLSNWETGTNTLTRKGWEYHDSKRGNTNDYSTISYSYGKDDWSNEYASAWFKFYTYNNRVECIDYQPTDNAYKNIKASLAANGYKQTNSKIEDNSISTYYANPSFVLIIETTTQERRYGSGTIVSYMITLIRKGGIYDYDNGEKVDYYDGTSTVKTRYTLKDGKRNGKAYSYSENGNLKGEFVYLNGVLSGAFKVYHPNGNVAVSGTLLNGEKNGLITEYDEYGDKESEIYYKNGKRDGKATGYNSEGRVSKTLYYTNDEPNGAYNEYYYDNNGEMNIQYFGKYANGNQEGRWETKALIDGTWITITYQTYYNGILNGAAKIWTPGCDSIVYCNYNNGKLDGKYQEKVGLFGSGNLFNEENLYILTDGYYSNGKKSGYWKYNTILMQPLAEGKYEDDDKEGVWKYYYINCHLDRIANYHWGKLHGKFIKYKKQIALNSFYNSTTNSNETIKDSIDYICYYSYDELNGHFEKHDNDGNIIAEGDFSNNLRNGRWTEIDTADGTKWMSNFSNGKLDGVCERFTPSLGKTHTYNYKNGIFDGRQVWYQLRSNSPFVESEFKNGHLQKQTVYKEDKTKSSDFKLTKEGTTSFNGIIINYYSKKDNSEIGKIVENYYFNIHPDSILSRPFIIISNVDNKQRNGKMQVFDHQNQIVVDGTYTYGKQSGNWICTFYDQNLYYIINHDNEDEPWLFNTLGSDTPYSGKFTRPETKGGTKVTAVYKIKKSLIEEIVYTDPTTGKTLKKEKYKEGLPVE